MNEFHVVCGKPLDNLGSCSGCQARPDPKEITPHKELAESMSRIFGAQRERRRRWHASAERQLGVVVGSRQGQLNFI